MSEDRQYFCTNCIQAFECPEQIPDCNMDYGDVCPNCKGTAFIYLHCCETIPAIRAWLGDSEEVERLKADDMARVKDMSLLLDKVKQLKAELEAAEQWTPASEPPSKDGEILLWLFSGIEKGQYSLEKDCFYARGYNMKWEVCVPKKWHDLPAMPEQTS